MKMALFSQLVYMIVCILLFSIVKSFQTSSFSAKQSIQPLLRASSNNFLGNLFKPQQNKGSSFESLISYVRKEGNLGLNDGIRADVVARLLETSSKLRKLKPSETYKLSEGTWRVIWTTEKVKFA